MLARAIIAGKSFMMRCCSLISTVALSELVDKPFLRLMDWVDLALDDSTKRNKGALTMVGVEFVAAGFEFMALFVFEVVFGDNVPVEVVIGFSMGGMVGFTGFGGEVVGD